MAPPTMWTWRYPPSYQAAAASLTEYWDIAAPYVASADLYAACLVSSKWHQVFAPLLWGNPSSLHGIEDDRVYGGYQSSNLLPAPVLMAL